jgi:hypothetical protein
MMISGKITCSDCSFKLNLYGFSLNFIDGSVIKTYDISRLFKEGMKTGLKGKI